MCSCVKKSAIKACVIIKWGQLPEHVNHVHIMTKISCMYVYSLHTWKYMPLILQISIFLPLMFIDWAYGRLGLLDPGPPLPPPAPLPLAPPLFRRLESLLSCPGPSPAPASVPPSAPVGFLSSPRFCLEWSMGQRVLTGVEGGPHSLK